jgi:predicted GNAT family N-acyltransferase
LTWVRYVWVEVPSPEYAAALALREAVLRRPLGLEFSDEDREDDRRARHFGAFAFDRLVGCLLGVPQADGVRVRQMVIAEEFRGRGIGAGLIAALEASFTADGVRFFCLNARVPAVRFYRRLGYREMGEPFSELGIPHQRMEKRLADF